MGNDDAVILILLIFIIKIIFYYGIIAAEIQTNHNLLKGNLL